MKLHSWTIALASVGLISLPSAVRAEEKPSTVLTALSSTTLSGYIDTSAQWNMGTGNINVPNYAFGGSSKADGFNLNVIKLTLEKPVDGADAWGAGYKVDLLAGPDADFFSTQSTLSTGKSDFGIKQAYVALHAPVGNGLDFKLGVWDTIMGYEVFESINNPNFTRSYGYTIEPTTHTGLQATYQFCPAFSATLAVVDSFGPVINERAFATGTPTSGSNPRAESYKSYMGSFTFTAPTNWSFLAGSTISACIMNGYNAFSPATGGPADQTSYYIGASLNTPVTGLKVGVCYDYAGVSSQPITAGTAHPSGYANVVGGYTSYQITEKLSVNARAEYGSSGTTAAFMAREIVEATATLQYDLWKNVLSRLEFRWDHAADGSSPYGGVNPGDSGGKKNSYILLANIAYKF